jgi:hypothetical protein
MMGALRNSEPSGDGMPGMHGEHGVVAFQLGLGIAEKDASPSSARSVIVRIVQVLLRLVPTSNGSQAERSYDNHRQLHRIEPV